LIQIESFLPVYHHNDVRVTFASCWNLGYIWGSKVPFYEAFDLSSQSEAGGTEVLGGARSLRGFREYRFTGPLTALVNLELRSRFYKVQFLGQTFSFGVVPFLDFGRVWDDISILGLEITVGVTALADASLGIKPRFCDLTSLGAQRQANSSSASNIFFNST
jgi:outer membrane translocation and assembly module TamA